MNRVLSTLPVFLCFSVCLLGRLSATLENPQTPSGSDDPPCEEKCGCDEPCESSQSTKSVHWQLNCGASRFVNTVALVDLAAAQPQEQQFVSGSAAKKQAPVRPERGGAGAAKSGGGAAAPAQRMEDSAAPSPVSNIVKQLQRSLSKNGRTTVWLKLDVPKIDSNFICSPSLLTVNGNSGAIITENGMLRQINTEDAFTDISVVVTGKKFRVRSWNRAAWTPGGLPPSGFWKLPNEISYPPTSDTLFENPDATSAGRLKITTISRMGSATDTSVPFVICLYITHNFG